jgi:hypothetical protein
LAHLLLFSIVCCCQELTTAAVLEANKPARIASMSPAQAHLLGGYYLHTAYSTAQGGKRTQKKNGKSKKKRRPKKRPWQNDGNKKYPAWRLLLCPELWPGYGFPHG